MGAATDVPLRGIDVEVDRSLFSHAVMLMAPGWHQPVSGVCLDRYQFGKSLEAPDFPKLSSKVIGSKDRCTKHQSFSPGSYQNPHPGAFIEYLTPTNLPADRAICRSLAA